MPAIRSAGAVIYRTTKKGREYLLLQHPDTLTKGASKPVAGHWDFPKGHIEKGEKTEDTIRREIREETGITHLAFIPDFKHTIRYFVNYTGARQLKFVVYYLTRTSQKNVTVSWEHQGYAWLPYKEARERLTYNNAKGVLEAAEDFLSKT